MGVNSIITYVRGRGGALDGAVGVAGDQHQEPGLGINNIIIL